jgi:ribonuclease P protein component
MPTTAKRNTFSKPEKICSQTQIDLLFAQRKSLSSNFFRLIYLETEASKKPPVQLLIAVPKKKLRHAVDRNRMKRLIREAYRLNKHNLLDLYSGIGKHCDIALVFTGNQCITQSETTTAIKGLLNRLIQVHEKNPQ